MGSFLSSTASIDAILTRKGRQLLAQGNFNPTKFALSDDYIDYSLLALPDGENMILNTQILEAGSLGQDSNTQLRYKLIIDSSGRTLIPQLDIQPSTIDGIVYQVIIVRISTTNGGSDPAGYTISNTNSLVTINPNNAIQQLNKQTYISQTNKQYQDILNVLNNYVPTYGFVYNTSNPLPEQANTVKAGTDTQYSFFLFLNAVSDLPINVNIVGNNSGAVGSFTITEITVS